MRANSLSILALALFATGCGDDSPAETPARSETTVATCTDQKDNDGDGLADCQDPGCLAFCTPASETNCADRQDNDRDGTTDCGDADCGALQGCGPESTDALCSDERDNDADGLIDCEDDGCRDNPDVDFCDTEDSDDLCRDTIDNDRDGAVDCDDSDCDATAPCNPTTAENTAATCRDRVDNDDDSLIDCQDNDCQEALVARCAPAELGSLCSDQFDNDGDLDVDCADYDCTDQPACNAVIPENTVGLCQNGEDDDGDAAIDCKDPDCLTASDVTFCGPEQSAFCQDLFDNDGDTLLDCDDPDCAAHPACAPIDLENTLDECRDLTDNDNDQLVDCKDPDCKDQPQCGAEDTAARCSDAFDNDGDGLIDCLDNVAAGGDTNCSTTLPCTGAPEDNATACSDAQDNDGDNLVDCADPGCVGVVMTPACAAVETGDALCNDDFDNDGDGEPDCEDPDCAAAAPCVVSRETSCSAGSLDACCSNHTDDETPPDGFVDCADFDCLLDFAAVSACDLGFAVHDLQDPTDNDLLPLAVRGDAVNDPVRLRNVVVTFIDPANSHNLWVADNVAAGTYNAARVFIPTSASNPDAELPETLAVGDLIDLAGLVTEFVGETEVLAYAWRNTDADATPPVPVTVTVAALTGALPAAEAANDRELESPSTGEITDPVDDLLTAERYEGQLCRLADLVVTGVNLDATGAEVQSYSVAHADAPGGPTFLVGSQFAAPAQTLGIGQQIASVTGIIRYHRLKVSGQFVKEYRLQPQKPADWVYTLIVDRDGDGLADSDELAFGTDPDDPDTDRDYFADGDELRNPTDPFDSLNDFDSDGINDALDSFLLDRDGDDVPDELDAVALDGPADDRDADGVANAGDPDDDGDGVCDPGVADGTGGCTYVASAPDNCPYAPESFAGPWPNTAPAPLLLQRNLDVDLDSRLWGDVYTAAHLARQSNPALWPAPGDACDWDPDGDFWPGAYDNCPWDYNFGQADSDGDGIGDDCPVDAIPFRPIACEQPAFGGSLNCDLIIEEVLYNLSTAAPAGVIDANRDNSLPADSVSQDEFIELRNISGYTLDLSGLVIEDEATLDNESAVRHRFAAGTRLFHGQRLVVFAGGTPTGFPTEAVVQTSSSVGLGLNNAGDTVYLIDPETDTLLVELAFGRSGDPRAGWNISVTRYPDGTDTWVPHPMRVDPVTDRQWSVSPATAPDNDEP